MQEARVQVETQEPIDGEIRAYWFTLPIDTELFEEVLGIDAESDNYYITDKELPFADEVREDTTVLELNDLYEMYQRLPDGIREEYKAFLGYYENSKYIITSVVGHIFELYSIADYEGLDKINWKSISLPYVPENYVVLV